MQYKIPNSEKSSKILGSTDKLNDTARKGNPKAVRRVMFAFGGLLILGAAVQVGSVGVVVAGVGKWVGTGVGTLVIVVEALNSTNKTQNENEAQYSRESQPLIPINQTNQYLQETYLQARFPIPGPNTLFRQNVKEEPDSPLAPSGRGQG